MFHVYTVSSLGADPRSVVCSDGVTDRSIPCLASYSDRTVGDQVLAAQLAGGSWIVFDKIGADDSSLSDITYGNGDPAGGGWRSSNAVWIRDEGQGRRSLYIDTGNAIPFPATVPTTYAAGYRVDGTGQSENPRAGAISATSGDWFGAWFYADLVPAVGAGLVNSMTVQISRTDNGVVSAVPLFLGLHTATPGTVPTITSQWTPGVSLARNGTAVIPIPAAQRALLGSGAAAGVAAYGSGPQFYAEFEPSAPIVITYG